MGEVWWIFLNTFVYNMLPEYALLTLVRCKPRSDFPHFHKKCLRVSKI